MDVGPGCMWKYYDPDLKVVIAHPYWVQVKAQAHALRAKAGLPIPHNWDDWFEERVCDASPDGCIELEDVTPEPPSSSWMKLALQFTGAMVGWAKSGFRVVRWDTFKARLTACRGDAGTPRCPMFRPHDVFGMGRCGKCGCTSLKLFLATERCPLDKWPR